MGNSSISRLRRQLEQERRDEARNGSRDSRIPGLLAEIEREETREAAAAEPRDWAFRVAQKIAPEIGAPLLPLARALRRETGGDLFDQGR